MADEAWENAGRSRLLELYLDAHTDLRRYLRSKLSNSDDVDDVEQECYLRIQRTDNFHTVDNPRAFLFRIAANLLIDRARQQVRRDRYQKTMGRPIYISDAEDAPSSQPTPETCAEAQEELLCVLEAIQKLPPKCQKALIMQRLEGLSHDQISRHMQVSKSMVEKYIAQAMFHLHKLIA